MRPRFYILFVCFIANVAFALDRPVRQAQDRPNIVYIMTDDHAAQMMSAYDDSRASTPNLDRIGEEGMLFRNSFCTNSLCAPSRATLLTGKYSHKNGQRGNRDTFDGGQPTFPKMLQAAGYQTAMIGKWHLKSEPTGFDYWNILPGQGLYVNPVFIEMGEKKTQEGYVTDIITDKAIDWVKKRDKEKPFLLLYHHKAPHAQWVPDGQYDRLFEDEAVPYPENYNDDESGRVSPVQSATNQLTPDMLKRWKAFGARMNKEDPGELEGQALKDWMYQQYVKDYKRVMVSVDENVGRFMEFLNTEGLGENTIVIYTADNGMFIGDHGRFDKRLMDEESLRIPLVVRYPNGIKAGSITNAYSLNVDYAPTILDYAGVSIPSDMQGHSLRPILEGKRPKGWRKAIYYHYYEHPDFQFQDVPPHYGVRDDRYKLIHYYKTRGIDDDAWELLDMKKDPQELTNVYENSKYKGVVKRLKKKLNRLRTELDVGEE
ncbi:MAG: sulfatase family protein [Verrucomicrobiia bacterium]